MRHSATASDGSTVGKRCSTPSSSTPWSWPARDDQDRRAEQLRKFIQVGVPLLVSHPVVDSMLVYYELDMIRRETGSIVLPQLAERHHPAIDALSDLVRQGAQSPIGKVEQVMISRSIGEPTKAAVVAQFARDVDLIRAVAGDMTRLGAMAGGADDEAYGSLGVQMSGPSGIVARWSVVPSPARRCTDRAGRTAGQGDRRGAFQDDEPWTMELVAGGQTDEAAVRRLGPGGGGARPAGAGDRWPGGIARLGRRGPQRRVGRDDRPQPGQGANHRAVLRGLHRRGDVQGHDDLGRLRVAGVGHVLLGVVAIAEQMGVPHTRVWPYLLLAACGRLPAAAAADARLLADASPARQNKTCRDGRLVGHDASTPVGIVAARDLCLACSCVPVQVIQAKFGGRSSYSASRPCCPLLAAVHRCHGA